MIQNIEQIFEKKFGKAFIKVQSPGRINLIGEHTDYNGGFVLPASIDLGTFFICAPNNINKFRFYSYNLDEEYEIPVGELQKSSIAWTNYLLGTIVQFIKDGKEVHGFDCVFGGNIPIGAGLSSSASVETGLAYAINQMEGFDYPLFDLVRFSQKAEHEYADVQCGIMDQFAVMYGKSNQVIKLDCRSLDHKYYSFEPEDQMLVLVNSGVKHNLEDSKYNIRRQECESGVELLQEHNGSIQALRDVTIDMLKAYSKEFDPVIYKRCRYVIEENMRVEKACKALEKSDFSTFGQQMYASHEGLKNLYEVSCQELDFLVDLTKSLDGVKGARMMGGGFGGCTLNLLNKADYDKFEKTIISHYKTPDGNPPQIIKIGIDKGTHLVET